MNAEYADWLNPMLVKELRQGLRKGVFVAVFVLVQVAMILFLGLRLLASEGETMQDIGRYVDGILWTGLGVVILLVMPLRGMSAIQEERKIQTLELVQMTWLGSKRIVWGKWVAIMSQVLLFTVAVLPYGVLRYFFGGMDIVNSLFMLGRMLLESMVISALCVWLSTAGAAMRGVAVFLGLIGLQMVAITSFAPMGFRGGMHMVVSDGLALVFGSVITTLFLLAMAASRIASIAENHAVVLRGLAIIAALASCAGASQGSESWVYATLPVMAWSMFQALTEETSQVPSMYSPWLAWGLPGRLACRVMNPGWATGLLFSLLITAMLAVSFIALASGGPVAALHLAYAFALFYLALVSPLVIVAFLNTKKRGALYLLFLALFVLPFVISRDELAGSIMPASAAIWAFEHYASTGDDWHWKFFAVVTLPLGAVIMLVVLFRAIREFRLMAKQERKAIPAKAPA